MLIRDRVRQCAELNTPDEIEHIIYIRRMRGLADFATNTIYSPQPKSRRSLVIFLHECAHFTLGHMFLGKPSHVKEYEANRWAFARMREFGLAVPLVKIQHAKFYTLWHIERDRALGETIAPHVRRYAKMYDHYYVIHPRGLESVPAAEYLESAHS